MEFIYEKESSLDVFETVKKVKTSLKENGFGTLFELNFKDKFEEHNLGYDHNFFVLEVCNPKQAFKILALSQDIGYFLPCKVVVYERENKVLVGMMKPTSMVHMITSETEAIEIAHEVEDVIKKSIELALK